MPLKRLGLRGSKSFPEKHVRVSEKRRTCFFEIILMFFAGRCLPLLSQVFAYEKSIRQRFRLPPVLFPSNQFPSIHTL